MVDNVYQKAFPKLVEEWKQRMADLNAEERQDQRDSEELAKIRDKSAYDTVHAVSNPSQAALNKLRGEYNTVCGKLKDLGDVSSLEASRNKVHENVESMESMVEDAHERVMRLKHCCSGNPYVDKPIEEIYRWLQSYVEVYESYGPYDVEKMLLFKCEDGVEVPGWFVRGHGWRDFSSKYDTNQWTHRFYKNSKPGDFAKIPMLVELKAQTDVTVEDKWGRKAILARQWRKDNEALDEIKNLWYAMTLYSWTKLELCYRNILDEAYKVKKHQEDKVSSDISEIHRLRDQRDDLYQQMVDMEYALKKQEQEQEKQRRKQRLKDSQTKLVQMLTQNVKNNPLLTMADYKSAGLIPAQLVEQIKKNAETACSLTYIPSGNDYWAEDFSGFAIPELIDYRTHANLCIEYNSHTVDEARQVLVNHLFNRLLSLPVGKMRLNIVDLNMTYEVSDFISKLDASLYNSDLITKTEQLRALITRLQERAKTIAQKCSNVNDYNAQQKNIFLPYETVVILGGSRGLESYLKDLLPLSDNGAKGGLGFVVMVDTEKEKMDNQSILNLTKSENYYHTEVVKSSGSMVRSVLMQPAICDPLIRYLNENAKAAAQTKVLRENFDAIIQNRLPVGKNDVIRFPIGDAGARKFEFTLDLNDNVHYFVLGRTGSGKSVLLRDIILGATARYAPEDLQLYLMDMKAGGVEFNEFEALPHTAAVLLNDTDRQIVYEVLNDLYLKMKERSTKFNNMGISKLSEYNAKCPNDHLPQIVLIVDECQRLFPDRPTEQDRKTLNILEYFATQGRGFGIHLIMASQTLKSCNVTDQVRANITNYFLLSGGDDRGLEHLRSDIALLQTGEVLYTNKQLKDVFQAYYVSGMEEKQNVIKMIKQKFAGSKQKKSFTFKGEIHHSVSSEDISAIEAVSQRNLSLSLGRSIEIDSKPVIIPLRRDISENVLVLGTNADNAMATAISSFLTCKAAADRMARKNGRQYEFVIIDNSDDYEYPEVADAVDALAANGCRVLRGSDRSQYIAQLVHDVEKDVRDQSTTTVILMLAQERFKQLQISAELPALPGAEEAPAAAPAAGGSIFGGINISPSFGGGMSQRAGSPKNHRDALLYLLQKGSEQRIHFIWQVGQLNNLLGPSSQLTSAQVQQMFSYLVLLRSLQSVCSELRLPMGVNPESLSEEVGKLRAYYINLTNNASQLITPYELPSQDDVKNL